jgi:glycosyltransferase involved in cell wall biosynthesis
MNGRFRNGMPEVVSFVSSQAAAVERAGWRVTLGVVDNRTSPYGILRNVKRLHREIAEARPAVVHAQYGTVTAEIANSSRRDRPFVISFCGDDLLGTPGQGLAWFLRSKAGRVISVHAARKADALIVKSRNLFESLPRELRSKATILPNGVDVEFFCPEDWSQCRDRLGWSGESKVVLFNASHAEDTYRKNPELARAAVMHASKLFPGTTMKVMSQNRKEEVRLMLNAADCLLVTSLHEGSPNIVKEAMACNLPVVSVNCGDVAERLKNVSPSAVCPYDATLLGRAIADIVSNPVRSNGRKQLLLQGLSASIVARRLIDVYSTLLA